MTYAKFSHCPECGKRWIKVHRYDAAPLSWRHEIARRILAENERSKNGK